MHLHISIVIALIVAVIGDKQTENNNVLVFTVASDPDNDYFKLYLNSARQYGIEPQVLGLGQKWKGGSMTEPGGGVKINMLKQALEPYKEEEDKIVLFTDSYDVLFTGDLSEIVEKFKATNSRVLFAAEAFCWPDASLKDKYPAVKDGKRFLNSGIYIGYLPEIWEVLNVAPIKDNGDDQGYFTRIYLDEALRNKLNIKLDSKSEVFMCLNGAVQELELDEDKSKESQGRFRAKNAASGTHPLVLHGNGPLDTKLALGRLGNYLANAWSPVEGCVWCKVGHIDLAGKDPSEVPLVYLAVFVEIATPFLEEHFEKIHRLDYPKERMHIFIHNNVKYHSSLVKDFVVKHGAEYLSVKQVLPEDGITEWNARDLSLDQCLAKECDMYFSVDSIAQLDNPHTLRLLIEQNRTVVAPMLVRPEKAWSNFWGALTKHGYYARSNDYMDIVHNEKRGLWIVPFMSNSYLVNATLLRKYDRKRLGYSKGDLDPDMAFCANLRELGVFMFVSNRLDFGHLVTPDTFDVTRTEPEMYQIFDNEQDWEQRYIHPDYPENLNPDKKPAQPCPDVYWFPIVTRKFTTALINMMEAFGKWSDGSNNDKRLEGGYEAVPTRDIHMNQVGWEPHWLQFLQRYVRPLQEHVFTGYYHDPPKSLMNFVVRYRPDEQPLLRPHHDSSTYTINIALNEVGTDYQGGGCRFIRYNCSVVDTKPGWLLMHPGRLTHYHEGLRVTEGTRYIMISFVDP